ncbi:hypothetical protein DsansV1_C22g0171571 [Dioscorea sansibarensis]
MLSETDEAYQLLIHLPLCGNYQQWRHTYQRIGPEDVTELTGMPITLIFELCLFVLQNN